MPPTDKTKFTKYEREASLPNNKLSKPISPSESKPAPPGATRKLGFKPLFQRVRDASASPSESGAAGSSETKPNRIALLLDCSGSMSSHVVVTQPSASGPHPNVASPLTAQPIVSKIQLLRNAVAGFVTAMDPADTSVALRTFPGGYAYGDRGSGAVPTASEAEAITRSARPLSSNKALLLLEVEGLDAGGGTPMAIAIKTALAEVPMTRAVLVSDGEADNPSEAIEEAKKYNEASLPIDCVHIGDSHGGEATLREIASITKGLYIKFTDVSQFAKSFAFLAQPAFRAMLTEGDAAARRKAIAKLGATEVRL